MEGNYCTLCNYTTLRKNDFNKHLKTKKHIINESKSKELMVVNEKVAILTQKNPKKTTFDPKMTQNELWCQYCNKVFSTKSHKNRHQNYNCKSMKEIVSNEMKVKQMKKEFEKQKKELMKQIEVLLTKVGNTTTINQTNNIQLNNYGSEDLSHISNNFKIDLLKIPFGMIPKMIKEVHFNNHKPENKNIMIPNSRDNKVRVFENGEWKYKNKKLVIKNLMDQKYYILDDFYNEIENDDVLNDFHKTNYRNFTKKYEEDENKQLIDI
jgi:hypothetical protein